jgi:hypothetical protein
VALPLARCRFSGALPAAWALKAAFGNLQYLNLEGNLKVKGEPQAGCLMEEFASCGALGQTVNTQK